MRLDYLDEALNALEEANGLLYRLDMELGLSEEQERIFAALRYEHGRLADEANRVEEAMSYEYEGQ